MKKIILILMACFALITTSACSTTERAAVGGAIVGAAVGGATTGNLTGAAVGAAVGTVAGAAAGTLIGRSKRNPELCVYEDRRGREFVDDCPED